MRSAFGVRRFYRIVKFTKKRILQIPFSVFRFPHSVTAVILSASEESPAWRASRIVKFTKKANFTNSVFRILHSVFQKGVAGACPRRPPPPAFERSENAGGGGGKIKKALAFFTKICFFINWAF